MYRYLLFFFSLTLATLSLNAQNDCNYQLILNDAGEDGWNGAGVKFFIETTATLYTTNGATDTILLPVIEGDSISIEYVSSPGGNEDNNFQLLDSDGQTLISQSNPTAGIQYEGFVSCPICPAIVWESTVNIDSFDNRFTIGWGPSDSLGIYQIQYAPCGFLNNPDSVQLTQSTVSTATINNLRENTCYEYQVSLVCTGGTQSIASDPHRITTIFTTDVGISGAFAPQYGQKCDFSQDDTLFVFLKNYGAAPQTLVPFDFFITKDLETEGFVTMPDDGLYTGVLTKDSCVAFPFEKLINISEPGNYTITMYTQLDTDSNTANDTSSYIFSHTQQLPFFEDFENNELPERWTSNRDNPVSKEKISNDLGPLNSRFILTTDRYGRISSTDSLSFNFELLNFDSTTATLTAGDQLIVEVSDNCEETYNLLELIDMSNFDSSQNGPQSIKVPLSDYEGGLVNFRFTALRGGSSFIVTLDNINVYECGINSSLTVKNVITPTSMEGEANGSITVSPVGGIAPYEFKWSTGITEEGSTSTLSLLGSGLYTVTVTDFYGCEVTSNFNIGIVNTEQLADIASLNIYPNPTQSILNVDISSSEAQALNVRVFNTLGQSMWSTSLSADKQHKLPIAVSAFNSGIYFIQLSSASGQITKRFIVE